MQPVKIVTAYCCSAALIYSRSAGELLSKVEAYVRGCHLCNLQFQPQPEPTQKNPDRHLVFHTRTAVDTIIIQST